MKRIHLLKLIFIPFALLLAVYLYSHYAKGEKKLSEAVIVAVAPVIKQSVTMDLQAIGQVQPYATVEVQPRVDGQLLSAAFREGQVVEQGQILFQVDSRPYKAMLTKAQADLARDKAQLNTTRLLLERYKKLDKKGYISKQDLDQAKANVESLEANVKADQAAIDTAMLNLDYCTITAPLTGRTGNILVHPGNIIKASEKTPLVTINQLSPIYIKFSIPEQKLRDIQLAIQQKVPVNAIQSNTIIATGQLNFIDNKIDNTTGMIQLKAIFNNNDEQLWPGQFIQISLPFKKINDALIIPSAAVQTGQSDSFVYVIDKQNQASYRSITLGPIVSSGIVITKGLSPGEQVVIAGQLHLKDGSKVEIRPSA